MMTRRIARRSRILIYHLIARFVGGEWFIKSDVERIAYLSLLRLYLQTTDWRCFAFALMSNHIHLALMSGQELCADGYGLRITNSRTGSMSATSASARCSCAAPTDWRPKRTRSCATVDQLHPLQPRTGRRRSRRR